MSYFFHATLMLADTQRDKSKIKLLDNLPESYQSMLNQVNESKNEEIKNIYSKFSFKYFKNNDLNDNNSLLSNFINYFQKHKFISYHYPNPSDFNKYTTDKTKRIYTKTNTSDKTNCVFCVEGECIIFEQDDKTLIN